MCDPSFIEKARFRDLYEMIKLWVQPLTTLEEPDPAQVVRFSVDCAIQSHTVRNIVPLTIQSEGLMFPCTHQFLFRCAASLFRTIIVCLLLGVPGLSVVSQVSNTADAAGGAAALPNAPQANTDQDAVTVRNTPIHILKDQGAIWTSPLLLKASDLKWLVPLTAATAAGLVTDRHTLRYIVSHDAGFNQTSVDASNVAEGALLAAPVAFYGLGYMKGNEHARETGILGAEAIADGLVVEQGLKLIAWRERPTQDNGRGLFFQGSAGIDSSFPSAHATIAWSSAALIASEYPSHWTQIGVYTLATGVSLSRVMGQQHFPTDVLVGSATGWLIGRYVYKTHHRLGSR
jgi:PAP2 superfamily